jgi:hypothetical protein
MKLQFFSDGLTLLESVDGKLFKISGSAIHPCKTFHPNEWAKVRQYVEPYLEQAAPTLTKAPVTIDHSYPLQGCKITVSVWKDGALIYEGLVTADVADKIRKGVIKHVSVGVDWTKPGGGVVVGEEGQLIPYAFEFNEFSFLQNMDPGDNVSTVHLWEGVLKEAVAQVQQPTVEKPQPLTPLQHWRKRRGK